MTASHFGRIVVAELRKVFTRGTGLSALGVAVAVGVFTSLMLNKADHADNVNIMGQTLGDMVQTSAVSNAGWALWARNFFLEPILLVLATATAIASEHGDRTMREVLVRPVPRWSVLASRVLALGGLSVATLLLTLASSLGLGIPLFGFPEGAPGTTGPALGAMLGGYAVCVLSDLALIVWTVAVALVVRSAGLVLVGMTIALLVDFVAFWVLYGLGSAGVETAAALHPWTLFSTLHAWQGWENGYELRPFVMLAVYTAAAGGFALVRFQRLDTP